MDDHRPRCPGALPLPFSCRLHFVQDFIRKFTEKNCEKFLVTRDEFSLEQTEIHVQYKRSLRPFPPLSPPIYRRAEVYIRAPT
jgi:hypothetical protein